jgi:hypothetical protein
MSKQSILSQLESLEDKEATLFDHVLICIESDEHGIPRGSAVKVKGTPFQTLGMLDLAIAKLEEARDSVHEKFQNVEDASRMINKMPKDVVDKIRKFEEEAREALSKGDIAKMESLRDQIKNDLGLKDDDSDEDGFNINDFKG